MAMPRNMDEYMEQFMAGSTVSGYGLNVTQHLPCPWCCFKDFMLLQPAAGIAPGDERPTLYDVMETEHRCIRCGRSGKNIIDREGGGVSAEFVQTGGPDSPDWLEPAPRRVES